MPLTNYEIALGWSVATRSNVEDLIRDAVQRPMIFSLQSQPVSDGNTGIVTLDQQTHWDGTPVIQWLISIIPYAGFSALITKALGGFTVDSGQVSIRTRNEQNGYGTWNAWMSKPQPGIDYRTRYTNSGVFATELIITHRIVASF